MTPPETTTGAFAAQTLGDGLRAAWAAHPDRPAVIEDGGSTTTTDELAERAEAIAGALRRTGGPVPGQLRVAVELPRSADLVAALAGTALAGACQLALDPNDPPARRAFMLRDYEPHVLVTAGTPRLGSDTGLPTVRLPLQGNSPRPPPADPSTVDSSAYAVYTSGSTGVPKASVLTHRNLLNCLRWLDDTFALRPDDRVLYRTACGFDVSVAELYWPLLSGVPLVVPHPRRTNDAQHLAAVIGRHHVTTVHFVPSLLEMVLLALPDEADLRSLQRVLAGGEALPPTLVRSLAARCDAEVWNLYGPSECTIYSTAWRCDPQDPSPTVPIGRPVTGARALLLGPDGDPVADGEPGELFVGGTPVGQGYWRRPRLTAERFRPDPAGSGARMYATGDLARARADGTLEFLGRVDDQVKIRGYRIEPAEIEVAIAATPGVRAAVVVPVTAGSVTQLAAFVLPSGGDRDVDPDTILVALRDRLPAYMVPATLAVLDRLPVSPNGKLDRSELARQALAQRVRAGRPQPASSDRYGVVAAAWCTVLGLDSVGPDANFLELGGDSLAAVRVIRALKDATGRPIEARTLFETPVLAEFADRVLS